MSNERARARAAILEVFGWPPILSTSRACEYADLSRWTLYRAVHDGELAIAGRRGRALMFRREELDRWLVGASEGAGPASSSARAPAPKRTLRGRASSETTTMRLRALKKLSVN